MELIDKIAIHWMSVCGAPNYEISRRTANSIETIKEVLNEDLSKYQEDPQFGLTIKAIVEKQIKLKG